MPFRFSRLHIPEVVLVTPKLFLDDRGFFMETYKYSDFQASGICKEFVQDNYSHSEGPVLRGLHYQKDPKAQGKLVGVIKGKIFDVAVDLRKGSPTYSKWVGEVLSDENHLMLYVPAGFAHGFCALSDTIDVIYKVTAEYALETDRGIIWNDETVKVDWPIKDPLLSAKDAKLPSLSEADNNFVYVKE